jgi:hypothetical protein
VGKLRSVGKAYSVNRTTTDCGPGEGDLLQVVVGGRAVVLQVDANALGTCGRVGGLVGRPSHNESRLWWVHCGNGS